MKKKYSFRAREGAAPGAISIQNNGTMHKCCAAPSGATQFYRGVLFWIYKSFTSILLSKIHVMYYHKLIVFPILYDSQFKKWHAQCFLRLHKYKNDPIIL